MHFQVVEITLDVALASIRFLPIITLQCTHSTKMGSDKLAENTPNCLLNPKRILMKKGFFGRL